jgi:hypothetical protein
VDNSVNSKPKHKGESLSGLEPARQRIALREKGLGMKLAHYDRRSQNHFGVENQNFQSCICIAKGEVI